MQHLAAPLLRRRLKLATLDCEMPPLKPSPDSAPEGAWQARATVQITSEQLLPPFSQRALSQTGVKQCFLSDSSRSGKSTGPLGPGNRPNQEAPGSQEVYGYGWSRARHVTTESCLSLFEGLHIKKKLRGSAAGGLLRES